MGNGINKVDEGLFICSLKGLQPLGRLRQLGIRCVLNAAQAQLYEQSVPGNEGLAGLAEHFEVLIIGAQDAETCKLNAHFEEIADFIEAGRAKGGIVVHCAAGISRASTSVLCYLLLREHWELEAAFRRLHAVRPCVEPNPGFWRQLRELEASLRAKGVQLRPLPAGWSPPEQPFPEDEAEAQVIMGEGRTVDEKIAKLDEEAAKRPPSYVTARLVPADDTPSKALAARVGGSRWTGVTWESVVHTEADVTLRAGLTAPLDCDILRALLYKLPGVQMVTVEPCGV